MYAYLLLHQGEHTFYRFRGVNSVTLSNKFTMSYGDTQMVFTWSALRIWREDFLLSTMATVVDLSNSNTYHAV